jgi:hypothetical protein
MSAKSNLGSGRLGSNHLACDSHQFPQKQTLLGTLGVS